MGWFVNEALAMSAIGGVENNATAFNRFRCQTMMHHSRREKTQSGMAVFVVIPGEELQRERTVILERPLSLVSRRFRYCPKASSTTPMNSNHIVPGSGAT